MKVDKSVFERGVNEFLERILATMPSPAHKFLGGVMLGSSRHKVGGLVERLADHDGCIDTDWAREAIKDGFAASGDKVSFTVGDDSISWLVKPVTISITNRDIEQALEDIEAHAR